MVKKKESLTNLFPVTKMVKIPVYSTIRYENGKLVGDIEGYVDTPIEWLQDDIKRKEH
ncbi:hypothetical protein [Siminovitchia terrae]|uniref:hypothetical protein n=1 Tax=Siminovitchia terrae TaxID=1914933 RepID=UPI00163C4989|nr:hypothetical protein [Siminovitchia terrae]